MFRVLGDTGRVAAVRNGIMNTWSST